MLFLCPLGVFGDFYRLDGSAASNARHLSRHLAGKAYIMERLRTGLVLASSG